MLRIDAPGGISSCDTDCPSMVKTRTSTRWSVMIIIDRLPVYMAMPFEVSGLLRLGPSITASRAGRHSGRVAARVTPGDIIAKPDNTDATSLFIIPPV